MTGPTKLESIIEIRESSWHVKPGRLMSELASDQPPDEDTVLYDVVHRKGREASLTLVDRAGLRGRAGGGFPTGHKWWLVSTDECKEKFFVCNANLADPGRCKESWFLLTNPAKVVEAVAIAAYCAGAHSAYLALPENAQEEIAAVESALRRSYDSGTLGQSVLGSGYELNIKLVKTPAGAHLAGEETALLEFIEGKPLQPRKKPPLPASQGLFGKPTAVNNLETILQGRFALKVGVDAYRSVGIAEAPGTMVFSLRGHVNRPGLYELPLGTTLHDLIFTWGGGAATSLKGIFPGGISSPVLTEARLDTRLDFDSLRDAGSDLGSGVVIAIGPDICAVELATRLARFFHDASCGKCRPCKDGTGRTHLLLSRIDQLDRSGIDVSVQDLPASKRQPQPQLTILNNIAHGISYTDAAQGLDKILYLCEFFKFRGDCHHSVEAASSLLSLLRAFPEEFARHMQSGACQAELDATVSATKASVNRAGEVGVR